MKLKVQVDGLSFDVPCGAGTQTIKWLALVASQRYDLIRPHGRSRAREETNEKRGFFLPWDVTGKDGSIAPTCVIKDTLVDGEELTVTLQKVVNVDDVGAPIMSAWQNSAFTSDSKASQRRLRGEEMRKEIVRKEGVIAQEIAKRQGDVARYLRAQEQLKEAEVSLAAGDVLHHTIIAGRLESEEDAASALEFDWTAILASLEALNCAPTVTSRDAFRDSLRSHYILINSAFVRFAGLAKSGEPYGLSMLELAHFAHVTRLARYRNESTGSDGGPGADERDRIVQAFKLASGKRMQAVAQALKVHNKSNEQQVIPQLLSRAEFVAAIIFLARHAVYGTMLSDELHAKEDAQQSDKDHDKHANTTGPGAARKPKVDLSKVLRGSPETAMDALESLEKNHLRPFVQVRREVDGTFTAALESKSVEECLHQARIHLRRVFEHYATTNEAERPPADESAITLAAFKEVLKDAGLMALLFTEEHANERLEKVAINAFLSVQNDPPVNLELDDLVFVEFMEAYSRVANDMLDSQDLSSKILLGIEQLCELSLSL